MSAKKPKPRLLPDEAHDAVMAEVLSERQSQRNIFSARNDDRYRHDELPNAAVAYTASALGWKFSPDHHPWPWAASTFKPRNRREDLIRAACLIIAELERMERADMRRALVDFDTRRALVDKAGDA